MVCLHGDLNLRRRSSSFFLKPFLFSKLCDLTQRCLRGEQEKKLATESLGFRSWLVKENVIQTWVNASIAPMPLMPGEITNPYGHRPPSPFGPGSPQASPALALLHLKVTGLAGSQGSGS